MKQFTTAFACTSLALPILMYCPAFALADSSEPFATANLNPFVLVHATPAARSATLPGSGQWSWHLQADFSNNFTESIAASEVIFLDGETHRANFSLRYGLSDRWEVALDVPYLRHTGGSLDGFIENWHETFGLPNGGREDIRDDQLNYAYQDQGLPRRQLIDPASGPGDITLAFGYRLQSGDDAAWTLRAGVKLPTGDADELTGSGATDTYTSLHFSDRAFLASEHWRFHGSIGVIAPGDGKVLSSRVEDLVIFGSGTIAWQASKRISLKAQLDYHSAYYDSDIREIGDFSAQLILGGSISLRDHLVLDISVAEDIVTDTSPDVVLQAGIRSFF